MRRTKKFDFGAGHISKSAQETKKLGKKIGNGLTIVDKSHPEFSSGSNHLGILKRVQNDARNESIVLALTGDLGSGKTTFVQGLAEGLGIKQRILSPTFILMRGYEIPEVSHQPLTISHFFHIDLYRLEENIESELKNLGVDEIWKDSSNIVVIEWAEKAKKVIPKNAKWIKFENLGEDKRRIEFND